jgi:hypothetical protein
MPGAERSASASPATQPVQAAPPAVTRDEVDTLVRRAGLNLNAGQKADLAVSYQLIVTLTGRIPRDRPIWDEPCFATHPAAPPAPPAPAPAAKPRAAAKAPAAKPAARAAAKPVRPAAKSAKAAPRPAPLPKPGKPVRAARPGKKAARSRR